VNAIPADLPVVSGRNMTDWGRMVHANVAQIAHPKTEAELQAVVRYAARNKLKISIRGAGHSALGHSIVDGGLMIDILGLNQVLELDQAKKTLRVQTGATWGQLTQVLEPKRLAIPTKQEFDNFTVGGSIAANIHGKTIDYGPIISHILSLRLLKADGEIVNASRTQNPDLFTGVIGGYGLLGTVVDATFQLVEDRVVEKSESVYMDADALLKAYVERVRRDPSNTPLCYGFFSSDCKLGFYVTYRYADSAGRSDLGALKRDETNPILFDIFAWLQRMFTFVRRRAFHAMWIDSANAETTLRSRRLLLWDNPPRAFQDMLLQKYYIPVDNFPRFIKKAGEILVSYAKDIKLLTNHFRFMPANSEALLACSRQDVMCFLPCYFANKDDPAWVKIYESVSNELVNACLDHGGSFYLTFIPATVAQVRRAYPNWDRFVALKKQYDPDEVFSSSFYQRLAR